MNRINILRLISIAAAVLVGVWLPLRAIGFPLTRPMEMSFDLFISFASMVNIYLHFQKHEKNWRKIDSWISVSLMLDFFCLLPLLFISDLVETKTDLPLVFLNLLTVRRIWRVKAFLDEFDGLQPVVYRLVPLAMMMPLLVHLIACGWIALGSGTAGPDPDKVTEYIRAIYWAFTTLTTVGYGDIAAKTPPQMLFAAMTELTGVGVFGFVLSNVASLLSRMDAAREHHMDSLDHIETFMKSYKIPDLTRSKVRSYYHYLWRQHRGYRDNTLVENLPSKLQSELYMCINKPIIEKVSFLKDVSSDILEDIVHELQPRIYVPGERVFHIDEPGDALYLIHSGQIEILTKDNQLIATLQEGAVFGEVALISDKPRNATARCSTYCDLYVLPKDAFNRVISAYPKFKTHLEDVMRERQARKAS